MLARSVAYNDYGFTGRSCRYREIDSGIDCYVPRHRSAPGSHGPDQAIRKRVMDTLTIGLQLVLLAQLLTALVRTPARTTPALLEKQEP